MQRPTFGVLYPYYYAPPPGLGPIEFARLIEDSGADGFWTGEAPTNRGFSHDAMALMCYAAAATKRITIGTSATVLPLHHPVEVAKQVASLDVLSNGRVVLTVGVGGQYPKQFEALGITPKNRGSRTNEAIEVMKRLWTQKEASFSGSSYSFDAISMEPKPIQKPHPPIWIGGRLRDDAETKTDGIPPLLQRVIRQGDGWNPHRMTPRTYCEGVELIRDTAAREGHDISRLQWAMTTTIAIGETFEQALTAARSWWWDRFKLELQESTAKKYVVGSLKEIEIRLREYAEAGVQHFILQFMCEPSQVPHQLGLLTKHVIPQLR